MRKNRLLLFVTMWVGQVGVISEINQNVIYRYWMISTKQIIKGNKAENQKMSSESIFLISEDKKKFYLKSEDSGQ